MHQQSMGGMGSRKLPQFVLFGDSLTQWSFDELTEGFGWYLEKWYKGKAEIVNEGELSSTNKLSYLLFYNDHMLKSGLGYAG